MSRSPEKGIFIDEAVITVESGKGGDGVVSFRREKYVPFGGPDGGHGGRGGHISLVATPNLRTLLDFRYKKHFAALKGSKGHGKNKTGPDGKDLVIYVPLGTVILDDETGEFIGDLAKAGDVLQIVRGGRGGRGNASFATPTNQTPRTYDGGEPGEIKRVRMELKLLADVGIIGYPNAGKSTLLSRVSLARPKIADYPFTTLIPNLGVVEFSRGDTAVFADIPGIIEGAHEGIGLGDRFLKHIERTHLLIHLVDLSNIDHAAPLAVMDAVNKELEAFSKKLMKLPQIVVGTKLDLPDAQNAQKIFHQDLIQRGLEFYPISAVTGEGVRELLFVIAARLAELPKEFTDAEALNAPSIGGTGSSGMAEPVFKVIKSANGFKVEGREVEKIIAMADLASDEGIWRLHSKLRKIGVENVLLQQGVKEGDTVFISGITFEYQENFHQIKSKKSRF